MNFHSMPYYKPTFRDNKVAEEVAVVVVAVVEAAAAAVVVVVVVLAVELELVM